MVEPNATRQTPIAMGVVAAFACTSFLSAFLLFQVQLIISKYILPWFGGAASVWTTSLLVFQVLLLGGYAYAHLVSERLSNRAQANVHLGLLTAAFLMVLALSLAWPSAITPSADWKPLNNSNPVRDVMVILLLATGFPYFVLSTTAPLLQRWFALRGGSGQTYRLYAVSNFGSLLGLLSFPALLEPTLRMTVQGRLWALLFAVFLAGCAWCAWGVRSLAGATAEGANDAAPGGHAATIATRVLWFLLAACASALLMASTNRLCQEIVTIPLLWVLPLALYLLSFILCFEHPRWYRREIFHPLLVAGIFGVCFASKEQKLFILPGLLFVVCMICHGELVKLKPEVRRLTSYYLAISAGGALGGFFVAILSPWIFRFFTEFQVSLAASLVLLLWCLFLDGKSWLYRLDFVGSVGIAAATLAAAYAAGKWMPEVAELTSRYRFFPLALLIATPVLAASFMTRPGTERGTKAFYPGQLLVIFLVLLLGGALYRDSLPGPDLYYSKRNFYGVLRVQAQEPGKVLFHGSTAHGAQLWPPYDRLPTTYYGPESGIGIMLQNHPNRHRGNGALSVGLVGLGVGTLATYGREGDYFRYYELNPAVVDLSKGPKPVFTFLRDSRARVDTELGDARLLLEREAASGKSGAFDILVLDAFNGDAIPVHLLTTEAFETYWKLLNPKDGVIAVHISSEHVDLLPVLQGLAERYRCLLRGREQKADERYETNVWVFLSRNPQTLELQGLGPPSRAGRNQAPRVWTDDFSDLIRLLH
jgi:hypothetical protein